MYERLTIRHPHPYEDFITINETKQLPDTEQSRKVLNRLCEVEDKICEGIMLELPCKIGQTVWLVTSPYNISGYEFEGDGEKVKVFECVVESITFYSKGTHQVRCYCNGEFVAHYLRFCDFGKTVFLTPEEANKKLKELGK